jgi:hypothetical protein
MKLVLLYILIGVISYGIPYLITGEKYWSILFGLFISVPSVYGARYFLTAEGESTPDGADEIDPDYFPE